MAFGIFENLAADDSDGRVAQRQATAVANKRVTTRFGAFLAAANSPSERTARLDLVRGDIREVIASACSEYGGDPKSIETSILSRLATHEGGMEHLAPGDRHLPGASPKRNRQYEHIKEDCLKDGKSEDECKELAARTVNKQRSEKGETKSKTAEAPLGYGRGPDEGREFYQDEPYAEDAGNFVEGNCPNCSAPLGPGDQACPGCGQPVANTQEGYYGDADAGPLTLGDEDPRLMSDYPGRPGFRSHVAQVPLGPPAHGADGFEEAPDSPRTINLEPNWEGMRAWVRAMAQTDPETARGIAESMGREAPPELQGGAGQGMEEQYPHDEPSPGIEFGGEAGSYQASVHTARRPKMCPYHREVTDISLASSDPSAGFNAMSQHAWGPQHCQGEYEGRCNWSREMVTQEYWDQKAQQAQERRELRDRERAIEQQVQETEVPESPEGLDSTEPAADPTGGPSITDELADAPSAVGTGEEATTTLEPMAAATREAEAPRDGGGAVKTVDVDAGKASPTPVMNKDKWTPGNLPEPDAEQSGTPVPTDTIDPLEPIIPENNEADFLDGTRSVTETQDVTQDGGPNLSDATGGSWSGNNGASPVTSAKVDPDANPLQQIVEEDFLSPSQVQSAIRNYEVQSQSE